MLNLQTDEDLLLRGIDWQGMEIFYQNLNIETYWMPMQDFDHDDQRERLPDAVSVLAGLHASGHIVYLHCTAGVGRSPLVAMAYLYWGLNMGREEAIGYVKQRRFCLPCEDLLEANPSEKPVC
jgi:protein-tyrosine phosphatase